MGELDMISDLNRIGSGPKGQVMKVGVAARSFLVVVLLIFMTGSVTAQIVENVYDLTGSVTQPDFWKFPGSSEPGIDATGALTLQIPLFTMESRKLNYPVQLHYRSGIKPDQMPSWAGLGWVLETGSISRYPVVSQPVPTSLGGTNSSYGIDIFDNPGSGIAQFPDEYRVSLPDGRSFEFQLVNVPSYSTTTIPEYSYDGFAPKEQNGFHIEGYTGSVTVDGISTGTTRRGTLNDYNWFVLTDPNGVRYVFSNPTLTFTDVVFPLQSGSTLDRQVHVDSWRLVWILGNDYVGNVLTAPGASSQGSWIRLEYASVHTFISGSSWQEPGSNASLRQSQYVSSIVSPSYSIEFTLANRVDPVKDYSEASSSGLRKRISEIRLMTGTTQMYRAVFEMTNTTNSFTPFVQISGTNYGRVRLNAIRLYGQQNAEQPGYVFGYAPNPNNRLLIPDDDVDCRDDYGYFSNTSTFSCSSATNVGPEAWSLTSVLYPRGSLTEITYEPGELFSGTVNGNSNVVPYLYPINGSPYILDLDFIPTADQGGPRIASLTYYDGNSGQRVETFTYGRGWTNGVPTRFLMRMALGSGDRTRLSVPGNVPNIGVYYESITRSIEDFGVNAPPSEHEVITYYTTINTPGFASEVPFVKTVRLQTVNLSCPSTDIPFGSTTECYDVTYAYGDEAPIWGQPWQRDTYSQGDNPTGAATALTKREVLDDKLVDLSSTPWFTRVFGHPSMSSNHLALLTQHRIRKRRDIDSFTTDWYFPQGSRSITVQQEYDNATNNVTLTRVSSTGSDTLFTTRYEYAHDRYSSMRNKNMTRQIARQTHSLRRLSQSPATEYYVSSSVTTWKESATTAIWVPFKEFSWRSDTWSTTLPVFNEWTSGATPSGWQLDAEFETYSVHGNPTKILRGGRHVIDVTWGFDGSRVTQLLFRRTPTSTFNNLSVSYTWSTLGQLITVNDQASLVTTYLYDSFQRLNMVRIGQGASIRTVTEREYLPFRTTYAGWTFSNDWMDTQQNRVITTLPSGTSAGDAVQVGYFDGFGRQIQSSQRQSSTSWWNDFAQYDMLGNIYRQWSTYEDATASATYRSDGSSRSRQWYNTYLGTSGTTYPVTDFLYYAPLVPQLRAMVPPSGTTRADSVYSGYAQPATWRYRWTVNEDGIERREYVDGHDRVIRTVDDAGATGLQASTSYSYATMDQPGVVTDPKGLGSEFTYNTLGQLIEQDTPDAGVTKYKYDVFGNLRYWQTAKQAQAGRVGFRTYDFMDRPVLEGEATATFSSLNPDATTPPSFETPSGSSNWLKVYKYDTIASEIDFPYITFYDELVDIYGDPQLFEHITGRLASVITLSNGAWQMELMSYNDVGHLQRKYVLTQRPGFGNHVAEHRYTWDRQNRLLTRHDRSGTAHQYHWYEYDVAGNLVRVFSNTSSSKPTNPDVTYTWTPAGGKASETYLRTSGSPVAQPFKYDIRGRLVSIGNVTNIYHPFSAQLNWSPASQVTEAQFTQSATPSTYKRYRYTFSYDGLQRLTAAQFAGHSGSSFVSLNTYRLDAVGYDLSGNITSLQRRNSSGAMWDNLSMSYASGTNRLSGFSNSASGYQDQLSLGYDANGNVTLYENADYTTFMTMGYDAYDRMVSVDEGMGTTITDYRYNSDGWRYYRKHGSLNPVYSIRDGSISLAEYTGTTGGVTWNIVLPDGSPIGRKPFSSGKSFYYRDHLGSTRTVVHENGTIQQVLDYYPFGLEMSGRGMVSGSSVLQRYTGYERTTESMLDYAGARWYNPRLGRFWSVDPMAGAFPAWSPYNYALNDPLRFIDPDGKTPAHIIRWITLRLIGREAVNTAIRGGLEVFVSLEVAKTIADYLVPAEGVLKSIVIEGTDIILPSDPTLSPGQDWEWRGKGDVGSDKGAWYNPKTNESLHPDLNHKPPVAPHWDYTDQSGTQWRIDPQTGKKEPKNKDDNDG